MTHAFSGSFDDTEGCAKCGCLTCICNDGDTEYDVDGVYTAKELARTLNEILARKIPMSERLALIQNEIDWALE